METTSTTTSTLLQLMGYPEQLGDGEFEHEDIRPRWRKVLERLDSNPEEASINEDGFYPLDRALWIQSKPLHLDVAIRMLRICPEAFTSQTYDIAYENENTRHSVMRLLRASDINGDIVEERTELVKLMGYPKYMWDSNYEQCDVKPNWTAVRERILTNPEEVEIAEGGCFPLADALWIKSDPVPIDIVDSFLKICPQALTDQAFENASHKKTRDGVLRLMFSYDRKQDKVEMDDTNKGEMDDTDKSEMGDTDDDLSYVEVEKTL
jgi:hypothetical protein